MSQGVIVVIRHGQTPWSLAGRHTSTTELQLTAIGQQQARALRPMLAEWNFAHAFSSPRLRARATAELAGLSDVVVDEDVAEWAYGEYEGVTTADIRKDRPGWDLWRDGCPGGESAQEVGARADRLLGRIVPLLADGDVAVVAHGHSLRVCAARWLGLGPEEGALFQLDTATVSVLGIEHDRHVLAQWNVSARL